MRGGWFTEFSCPLVESKEVVVAGPKMSGREKTHIRNYTARSKYYRCVQFHFFVNFACVSYQHVFHVCVSQFQWDPLL